MIGTAHQRIEDEETPALGALLDRTWTDQALRALGELSDLDDDDDGGGVARALWEVALLEPARDILTRPGKELRGRLVRLCWRLGGGRGDGPSELPLLVEVIHAGSLIIDDIEDDSSRRRGAACLHRLHGVPVALNTGNWMYFWPLHLVGRIGLPAAVVAALRERMAEAMFLCHFGQALDLSARVGRVAQAQLPGVVATMTRLKTGSLMELAATLGAVAAGAPPERVGALARFGRRLGVGLQMLDDLGNLRPRTHDADDKRHEDLRLGRATWPWAWAAELLDRASFTALERDARVLSAQVLAGGAPDSEPLALALREAIGVSGRTRAHAQLGRALDELRVDLGGQRLPEIELLREELARLEVAYG